MLVSIACCSIVVVGWRDRLKAAYSFLSASLGGRISLSKGRLGGRHGYTPLFSRLLVGGGADSAILAHNAVCRLILGELVGAAFLTMPAKEGNNDKRCLLS